MTRRFGPEPLAVDTVVEMCDLARRAPSAGYSQGTHFLVLSGDGVREFWEVTGAGRWFAATAPGVLDAPIIVLPLGDRAAYTDRYRRADKRVGELTEADRWPVPYWLTDTAMATQNLLLLAQERGLGALLFGIFRNERRLLDHLDVPTSMRSIGAVALGHRGEDDRPSGSPTRWPRRATAEIVHVGRFDLRSDTDPDDTA
jgi:nitroreductase